MNQTERRLWLIQFLLKEQIQYRGVQISSDEEEQKKLLRSLFNVRLPRPVSQEFLQIQDEYLSQRNMERGITDEETIPSV